jgi:CBS domain containing-hemolysin-like protein
MGGAADDPAVENRRSGRPRADRGDEPRAARVRHQGRGRAEPTEDEIKALISQGAETGAVGATEENIVQRVFQLGDQRVAAIMTPRPDIEWIDVDAGEEELREFLASHAHTQFVVCHGGLDEVLGIVRSADLLPLAFKGVRIDPAQPDEGGALRARLDARRCSCSNPSAALTSTSRW